MTTEICFFALKSKKEKGTYWIEVRTVFNVKTTTTTTTTTTIIETNVESLFSTQSTSSQLKTFRRDQIFVLDVLDVLDEIL